MNYPKTLEQLREEQGKFQNRERRAVRVDEAWEKLKAQIPKIEPKFTEPIVKPPQAEKKPLPKYSEFRLVVWDAFKEYAAKNNFRLELGPGVADILKMLTAYFCQDGGELDHNKGLFLFGEPGCGKSVIMDVFRIASIKSGLPEWYTTNCPKLANDFELGEKSYTFAYQHDRYFDDFGMEKPHIWLNGNKHAIMDAVIYHRYPRWVKNRQRSFFSSNMDFSQLRDRLSDPVLDRLSQITNDLIIFSNPSFRV